MLLRRGINLFVIFSFLFAIFYTQSSLLRGIYVVLTARKEGEATTKGARLEASSQSAVITTLDGVHDTIYATVSPAPTDSLGTRSPTHVPTTSERFTQGEERESLDQSSRTKAAHDFKAEVQAEVDGLFGTDYFPVVSIYSSLVFLLFLPNPNFNKWYFISQRFLVISAINQSLMMQLYCMLLVYLLAGCSRPWNPS